MKGIILAGGIGSRLYPLTRSVSKQLLPIYNKPMVYYPLSVLMLAGIRDILLVTTPEAYESYKNLLGDGDNFGINIEYIKQKKPEGLAHVFTMRKAIELIGGQSVCLILGDNFYYGESFILQLESAVKKHWNGAIVFGYRVTNPQDFGIIEFSSDRQVISIEEKPEEPKSDYAVTGLYLYDNNVIDIAKNIKPSARGELEITAVNNKYLEQNRLCIELLGHDCIWLDTGTPNSLLQTARFVQRTENRLGIKIACLEEIAFKKGWIDTNHLEQLVQPIKQTDYGRYLQKLLDGH